MKMNNSEDLRTPDLYYAAYLQVAGVIMKRMEREGSRVYFVFDSTIADIESLKLAWINYTGKVAAQPYANSIRSLKGLVHMP
jgi:hypothetical protein